MSALVAVEQWLLLAVHVRVGHTQSLPLTSNFDSLDSARLILNPQYLDAAHHPLLNSQISIHNSQFTILNSQFSILSSVDPQSSFSHHPLLDGVGGDSCKEHPAILRVQLEGNHCCSEESSLKFNS